MCHYIPNMTREIKTINGKQYEYEVSMVWGPDHRKRHKVSRYIGKIVDGKPTRIREIVSVKGIYEIGHLELIWSLMSDVIGTIRKTFPDDHMRILSLALNRVIYPMPLKSVKSWVEKTYLAKIVTEISPKSLSGMLRRIGSESEKQRSVFRSLMKRNEIIAYDTSALQIHPGREWSHSSPSPPSYIPDSSFQAIPSRILDSSPSPPRLPVTIHYSDQIAWFALRGIKPPNLTGEIPFWL